MRETLREAFDYEFSRLDPTGAHIDPPSVALYETLIAKGPDWGPHPLLAEAWDVSEDGLEWRVRLRPGLRFHSGAPCDAVGGDFHESLFGWMIHANVFGGEDLGKIFGDEHEHRG